MKNLIILFFASLYIASFSHVSMTSFDRTFVEQTKTIKPGAFGDEEFALVLTVAKSGGFSVSGYITQSGARRKITGSMSKSGSIRANMLMGAGNARAVPVNGNYDPTNDILVVTSIDGKATRHELARFGTNLIKVGTYSGRSGEPDTAWELTVSKSSGPDFNVVGFVDVGGSRRVVKGNLRSKTGVLRASLEGSDTHVVDGAYDFDSHQLNVRLRLSGGTISIDASLKPGKLPAVQLFGLVEKTEGKIPPESVHSDFKVNGIQTETSFQVDIIMLPPYEGRARVKNEYSSQLIPTLKPGQIVELTVVSTSDKSGSYQPNLAISGFWLVEGDGAQVLEYTKTFAGTASDGKFYASSQGKTRFKVLNSGTIKITAGYWGQVWGPAAAWNWNPCTYVYKFKEPAKHKIGS